MISESTPRTFSCVGGTGCEPKKHSRIAYSGLVPMSPYTTPSAVNVSGNRRLARARLGVSWIAGAATGSDVSDSGTSNRRRG